jgi:hypothetical protein
MLKRKKPPLKRRKLSAFAISSSRRRVKRNTDLLKLHRRRRNYQTIMQDHPGLQDHPPQDPAAN